MKKYFDDTFLEFYRELDDNNRKEWFHDHKVIYEKAVKDPFRRFVEDFIEEIAAINPKIELAAAAESIFRINRDMRFAKGLPIYKNFSSALISEGHKRSKEIPGFYIEFGLSNAKVSGGLFKVTKADLMMYSKQFKGRKFSADFYSRYGEVQLNEDAGYIIYEAVLPDGILHSENLLAEVIEYWKTGQEINQLLRNQNV